MMQAGALLGAARVAPTAVEGAANREHGEQQADAAHHQYRAHVRNRTLAAATPDFESGARSGKRARHRGP